MNNDTPVNDLCQLLRDTHLHDNNNGCVRPTHILVVGDNFENINKIRNHIFKVKDYVLLFKDDTIISFNEMNTSMSNNIVIENQLAVSNIHSMGTFWLSTTISDTHIFQILTDVLGGKLNFVLSKIFYNI
jgi:hypothetical protein